MTDRRLLSAALVGLLVLALGACTNAAGVTTTTTVRETATTVTTPAVLASNSPGVERFLDLVHRGLVSTFTATYRETYPRQQQLLPTVLLVAQRSGEWGVSGSHWREFNLKPGLIISCSNIGPAGWHCGELRAGMNMSGGGYFIQAEKYPPYGLGYQLETGLAGISVSAVHLYHRTVAGQHEACLSVRRGGATGDTWCILSTGQFAYFWSDSGSSQTGVQGLALTRISEVVPASAFVPPTGPVAL